MLVKIAPPPTRQPERAIRFEISRREAPTTKHGTMHDAAAGRNLVGPFDTVDEMFAELDKD